MAGREELAGRDVILVHRLLKNACQRAPRRPRLRAVFRRAASRQWASIRSAQGLVEHRESIDIIGEVTCWVRDFEAAWQKENDRQRNEVTRDKAAVVIEFDIAAPRPTVWEYFTLPGQRPKWRARRRGARNVAERPPRGRHRQPLHAWSPRHHRGGARLASVRLSDVDHAAAHARRAQGAHDLRVREETRGTTHIEIRLAKPKPKDKAFLEQVGAEFQKTITAEIATLRQMLEGQAAQPAVEEPMLPVSAERFRTEPVQMR